MVRVKLHDGRSLEFSREEVTGVYPCVNENLFRHSQLNSEAVFYHGGKLFPVQGPLPTQKAKSWIILFSDGGQVISELPTFSDDIKMPSHLNVVTADMSQSEEDALFSEMAELLKTAG